jgi:DMSO/TMAO reductase YedYZ heme-binding membrane subunit
MIKLPYWINVHKILIKYKKVILNLFLIANIFSLGVIALGFYLFSSSPTLYTLMFELSSSIGTLSLILFLVTLVPGILSRFKIFPLVTSSFVLFRRQIGILMFMTAIIHSFYLSTIPGIINSRLGLEFLSTKDLLGSISLMILLPVWLTSNDLSQKIFGKLWKIIQRLAYLSLIAIFFHVALSSIKWGIVIFGMFGLELLSWLKVWFVDRNPKK